MRWKESRLEGSDERVVNPELNLRQERLDLQLHRRETG